MTPIRIVLIEDHKLTLMGLKAALQQQPDMAYVGEADDAATGLAVLQDKRPDVAIVDIGLPDMDGIELVRRFRATTQTEANGFSTRILMLTMHETEKSVMAAFTAGADSYCMKQTDLDDLMVAIRETYEGNSWIDPAIASIVLRQARQSQRSLQPIVAAPPEVEPSDDATTVTINAVEPEYAQVIETYPLTDRELEILQLIVAGNSNASIAEALFITIGTVKTHVRNILNKLSASDRTQAAVRALRAGLVE